MPQQGYTNSLSFIRRPPLSALTRPFSTPSDEATDRARLPLYDDLRLPFTNLLERTPQITIEISLIPRVRSKVPASCLPAYHTTTRTDEFDFNSLV